MVITKGRVRQEMWDVHVTDLVCALGMAVKNVEMENEERESSSRFRDESRFDLKPLPVFSAMECEVMNTISAKIITEMRGCRFYCFSHYFNP